MTPIKFKQARHTLGLTEDTKITFSDLRAAGISERVISGISCLTKQLGESYDDYKQKVFSNLDAIEQGEMFINILKYNREPK